MNTGSVLRSSATRRGVIVLTAALGLLASGCGDSKDTKSSGDSATTTVAAVRSDSCRTLKYDTAPAGGELTDYAQLASGGDNTTFDPGSVQTLDESQITTALFDGLTDFDFTDTCNPKLKPLIAESITPNSDATEFVFKIRKGEVFNNGEPVLPSSFKKGWERAGSKELASPYGYLINFVKDGAKLQDGTLKTLDAIKADDAAMTLTVTLESPNADFPAIVTHPFFSPISDADIKRVGNTTGWGDKGAVIGNGPFKFVSAGASDSGDVVIERNDKWGGNVLGDKKANLDKITFKITQDTSSSYQAFDSGEGDTATIPSGRTGEATKKYKNTTKSPQLGTYYFDFGFDDPAVGGPKNLKLRQAISLAIDREDINKKVYEGVRVMPTGITPPGIPGFTADLCKYCKMDKVQAKKLFDEWTKAGGKLTAPLKLSFNSGGGHEGVVQIMQANLKDVLGIDSVLNPIEKKYFSEIAKQGACQICRSGWYADYPTYGNFMVDLFSKASIDGNNLGRYDDPEFEKMIAAAQKETDPTKRGKMYADAESRILNDTTSVIPVNWYVGDHVYRDTLINYDQPPLGLVLWEKVGKKKV